jgi:hypothetical protein
VLVDPHPGFHLGRRQRPVRRVTEWLRLAAAPPRESDQGYNNDCCDDPEHVAPFADSIEVNSMDPLWTALI